MRAGALRRSLAAVCVAAAVLAAVGRPAAAGAVAADPFAFPMAGGRLEVTSTLLVSGVLDGAMKRYVPVGLGDGDRDETQLPVVQLADGATLRNAIIGAPGADGVHCEGTCTLENVWWEDVGEDAATLLGTAPAGAVMTVHGGGARAAFDKVFQHNGPGTVVVDGFVVDVFGKLYRSCGNCRNGYQGRRSVVVRNITARGGRDALVGINENYGDTARISAVTVFDDPQRRLPICQRWTGNNTGQQPVKIGSGPVGGCGYTPADITYR